MKNKLNQISDSQKEELLQILALRFSKNMARHQNITWNDVLTKLNANIDKLNILHEMEYTGGEPDVVDYDKISNEYTFFDCSAETPKNRRSLCYDRDAWNERKEHKPENSAVDLAAKIGIALLDEAQYRFLQTLGTFDVKTSSWLATPAPIRKLGGAIFGDRRFDTVFIYHNGAQSYYAARGFRGYVKV